MGCERQGEIGKWEDVMVKKYRVSLRAYLKIIQWEPAG